MQNKEINMVIHTMGILAVIFCLLALFLPWGAGIYTFGVDFIFQWSFFYIVFFESGVGELIFFGAAMIIIFFLTIITLIIGFLGFRDLKIGNPNRLRTAGIIAIIEFVFYIVAVSVVSGGNALAAAYGAGFILILITGILFFVTYFLHKTFISSSTQAIYQQPVYQQPAYAQTQPVYHTQTPQTPQPTQTPPMTQPTPQQPQPKTTPKFCPQCGSPLIANAKFCFECGNKL